MSQTAATPTNYWRARVEAEREPQPTREHNTDDIWFTLGLAIVLALALTWSWAHVVNYGAPAIGFASFWTLFWAMFAVTAWVDVHRFDRAN